MSDIMFDKVFEELLDKLKEDSEVALLTHLEGNLKGEGSIKRKIVNTRAEIDDAEKSMNQDFRNDIFKTFESGIPYLHVTDDNSILIEPFYPKPRLVIFGGGHIAMPLTEFGSKVGFSILVIDDRPKFANTFRFPEADEVICQDFSNVFNEIELKMSDFVIIVTRGHKHDGICLRKALGYKTAYLGMIGSRRRVKSMMEELQKEGYDKERLNGICSPIGLDIGAVTPEEIAIAIIAQAISYRRNSDYMKKSTKFNWPEFDVDVIKEAASKSDVPRAMVTIISSKGSVPRKAGAKMIVYLDGRTIGTIGGGCAEANILTLARDVIRSKGYKIEHVDMTGEVAEDEGMVCGGVMDVLIEAID
jgi:xanthine dehydrogenase accessory factor